MSAIVAKMHRDMLKALIMQVILIGKKQNNNNNYSVNCPIFGNVFALHIGWHFGDGRSECAEWVFQLI